MFLDSLYCKHGVFKFLLLSMIKSSLKCTYNTADVKSRQHFSTKNCGKIKIRVITEKENFSIYINPSLTGNFANSEDTDEMQHNAAFHQCLHCL